ncbi:acetyl-CoA carboxylase biotin carboxyl carrier protein [Anaerobacillus isosaccharinicus]|uniref:Biotin carboxyl carrier protein of acetyl-CoA carboxylase n=1 Tax=Anaerobacillus isosaccharinicus TaxID=1532552 RepID=A0A1S2MFE4_9BACI|nr:acetyl-CoA carboxylase biotin carboxyl carrier protein [Anaerobacillus isosaccharinicus]MBA5585619.1 acetyl-CoA carboxylase biotin carboxyl carrier protein [Anaerobacillus isosaccharinicus]QOY36071.1 acetyl-CoA carboxylase biotin carboxyl carrier protein [Anaerobacillus isosaccharinicus]
MLKIQDIRELIKAIDQSSIEEFKYEQDGTKITMRKERKMIEQVQQVVQQAPISIPQQVVTTVQPQVENIVEKEVKQETPAVKPTNLHKITSPMVGTFYSSPSPDSAPYIKVGDQVKSDSVVCIVEAMKLMNEIEAEIKGEIVEILVENGQLVEYGQELFLVKPE